MPVPQIFKQKKLNLSKQSIRCLLYLSEGPYIIFTCFQYRGGTPNHPPIAAPHWMKLANHDLFKSSIIVILGLDVSLFGGGLQNFRIGKNLLNLLVGRGTEGCLWIPVLTLLKQAGHARTSKAPPQHCTASVSKSWPTYLSALSYISHIISQYFRYVIIPGPNSLHFQIFTSLWNLSFLHWLVSGPGHRSSPASGLPFLVLFGIREHLVSDRRIRWRPPFGNRFFAIFWVWLRKRPMISREIFWGPWFCSDNLAILFNYLKNGTKDRARLDFFWKI